MISVYLYFNMDACFYSKHAKQQFLFLKISGFIKALHIKKLAIWIATGFALP